MKTSQTVDLVFAGRYRLIKKLGEGAFGSVWQAEQRAFGIPFRTVALKKFETPLRSGMQVRQVFADALSLIRLLDACEDPLVKARFVQVYDVGSVIFETQQETPLEQGYITMEIMEKTLRAVIGETGEPGFRKCTVKETLDYLTPVVEALAYMHGQNPPMLHRDLKPANILLKEGKQKLQVKVADFGLATQNFHLVERPQAAGTWPYQDLECFTTEYASTESDVYSVGVMFYELLTGNYPYNIDFTTLNPRDPMSRKLLADKVKRAMDIAVIPPSKYNIELKANENRWLEDLIMKCLARERIERIMDAAELKRNLDGQSVVEKSRTPEEEYKYRLTKGKTAQYKGKMHWPEAEEEYRRAIRVISRACDAVAQLADLWIEQGRLDEAEKLLTDRLSKELKECSHVYLKLSDLYSARGNKTMAEFYRDKSRTLPACEYSIFRSKFK
ncbi:MAG: serine/threonine protein kinase [Calditrichaceae bacterium]|nr:serine/threonine protein kinase [Calditrichia bacterium]NUQ41612.1 serine/threonine protein kinase [Calditrichaceae bacterium]